MTDKIRRVDNSLSAELLGLTYTVLGETALDMAEAMIVSG